MALSLSILGIYFLSAAFCNFKYSIFVPIARSSSKYPRYWNLFLTLIKYSIFSSNALAIFSIIHSSFLGFGSSLTSGILISYPIIKFLIYSDWDKFNFEESLF